MRPCFTGFVTRSPLLTLTASAVLLLPWTAIAQPKHYPLESLDGLGLHNVTAEPVTLQGKKGLRLTLWEEARRRLESTTPEARAGSGSSRTARLDRGPCLLERRDRGGDRHPDGARCRP
jgi:hypothetical protein